MEIGDIVARKINSKIDRQLVDRSGKFGIVTGTYIDSKTNTHCLTILWFPSCSKYELAESHVEVINGNR